MKLPQFYITAGTNVSLGNRKRSGFVLWWNKCKTKKVIIKFAVHNTVKKTEGDLKILEVKNGTFKMVKNNPDDVFCFIWEIN